MMIGKSIRRGFRHMIQRPKLALLLYAVPLLMAALMAVPIYVNLDNTIGITGFSRDLAEQFNVTLWADIIEESGTALMASLRQLVWFIPVFLLWNVASHVGLIHTLAEPARGGFWEGLGRFTGRGLALALLFLIPLLFLVIVTITVVGAIAEGQGEVGTFWLQLIVLPLLLIGLVAWLDLMQDYGRMFLVLEQTAVFPAWWRGIRWGLTQWRSGLIYLFWFIPALVLWVLPFWFDTITASATLAGMWGLLLLQQFILLLRSALTIGWIGSEVALFEHIREPVLVGPEPVMVETPDLPISDSIQTDYEGLTAPPTA